MGANVSPAYSVREWTLGAYLMLAVYGRAAWAKDRLRLVAARASYGIVGLDLVDAAGRYYLFSGEAHNARRSRWWLCQRAGPSGARGLRGLELVTEGGLDHVLRTVRRRGLVMGVPGA